jgi:hypothetical protein
MKLNWEDRANYGLNNFNETQRKTLRERIINWANGAGAWSVNTQQVLNTRLAAIDVRITATRTAADRVTIDNVEAR